MHTSLAEPHPTDAPNRTLAGGIALVVLGVAAIAFDVILSSVTLIAVGLPMLIGGAIGLFEVGTRGTERRRVEDFMSSVVPILIGALLLLSPLAGLKLIFPLLLGFFVLDGVMLIYNALTIRDGVWGAELATGVVTLGLAVPLALRARDASVVLMATVVGIHLVGRGVMFIAASFVARRHVRASRRRPARHVP